MCDESVPNLYCFERLDKHGRIVDREYISGTYDQAVMYCERTLKEQPVHTPWVCMDVRVYDEYGPRVKRVLTKDVCNI